MIASKMADAKYIMVLIPERVLIYDGNEVKLQVTEKEILTRWRCKISRLWRAPLNLK